MAQALTDRDAYFYSLVSPTTSKKKRGCLRCGTVFMSQNAGHRVCASCKRFTTSTSHLRRLV